jgi:hypothetical protein
MGENGIDPGKATAEWQTQDPRTLGTYSRMSLTSQQFTRRDITSLLRVLLAFQTDVGKIGRF